MIWIGALAGQMVVQLSITGDCAITEEYLFRKQLGRIRDVGSDAGGALYMVRYTY
jgi:glucose/arabinose dehydrogenase